MDKALHALFKKALNNDADTSSAVREFLPCLRCLQGCSNTRCLVAHPTHLRRDLGGMSGNGKMTSNFYCGACNKTFSEVVRFDDPTKAVTVEGVKWCFDGVHTLNPLPESDQRRLFKGTVALTVGPDLQEEINALSADVETLTIVSAGFYDDADEFVLDKVRAWHLGRPRTCTVLRTTVTPPSLHSSGTAQAPGAALDRRVFFEAAAGTGDDAASRVADAAKRAVELRHADRPPRAPCGGGAVLERPPGAHAHHARRRHQGGHITPI